MKMVEQNLRFHGTIAVRDEIMATVTAKKQHTEGSVIAFDCRRVNQNGQERISKEGSRISAWVIPTNEELMIAMRTKQLLKI